MKPGQIAAYLFFVVAFVSPTFAIADKVDLGLLDGNIFTAKGYITRLDTYSPGQDRALIPYITIHPTVKHDLFSGGVYYYCINIAKGMKATMPQEWMSRDQARIATYLDNEIDREFVFLMLNPQIGAPCILAVQ